MNRGMNLEDQKLPDDIEELKRKVTSFGEKEEQYELEIKSLKEQIRLLRAQLFGRKSERSLRDLDRLQLLLFEAEKALPPEETEEDVKVPEHTRRQRGRKPLPPELPRVDKTYDLSDEEKLCACGCTKSRIGEEVAEQLDYVPARMQVIRKIRYKYACKRCEGVEGDEPAVSIAKAPEQLIPKSIASPGLIAHIVCAKFVDSLPFYRQESQFARLGVEIPRSSMGNWTVKAAERCKPMMDLLRKEIMSGFLVNVDETPFRVLNGENGKDDSSSYMWVFRGGPPDAPALIFHYSPTRSGSVPKTFFKEFSGYVQTDGYAAYDFLDDLKGVRHAGCWAHARRKFKDVTKAASKIGSGKKKKKKSNADIALRYITELYTIEGKAREQDLSPEALLAVRQEKTAPLLDEFEKWLRDTADKTPPSGLLGKAISYTLKQWDRLVVFAGDGYVRPDNNLAENAIRPFVVGRKNWLFNATPKGAEASGIMYSLIETAKASRLDPYLYLRYLFENLPLASSTEDYKALLPRNLSNSQIAI